MMHPIITYAVLGVGAVALIGGPQSAAEVAGKTAGTVGIVAGAFLGGADNLIKGFNVARTSSEGDGFGGKGGVIGSLENDKPQPQQKAKPNGGGPGERRNN